MTVHTIHDIMPMVRAHQEEPTKATREAIEEARASLSDEDASTLTGYLERQVRDRTTGRSVASMSGRAYAWAREEERPVRLARQAPIVHHPEVYPLTWGLGWALWSDGQITMGARLPDWWLVPRPLPAHVCAELDLAGQHFGLRTQTWRELIRALITAPGEVSIEDYSVVETREGRSWARVIVDADDECDRVFWRASYVDFEGPCYIVRERPWGQLESWLEAREAALEVEDSPERTMTLDYRFSRVQHARRGQLEELVPELAQDHERFESIMEQWLVVSTSHHQAQPELCTHAPFFLTPPDPDRICVALRSWADGHMSALYHVRGHFECVEVFTSGGQGAAGWVVTRLGGQAEGGSGQAPQ